VAFYGHGEQPDALAGPQNLFSIFHILNSAGYIQQLNYQGDRNNSFRVDKIVYKKSMHNF
jgi:hypothetical protein